MALDANDLMTLKSMENGGFSPYEQMKLSMMNQKHHTSGVAVTGLVTGIVGTVAGVTAWIFAPLYGNAKANQAREAAQAAKELANAQIAASQRQIDQLTNLFAAERSERINGDTTISQTITDTISGQQTSTLTAQQAAELSAVNSVMQQTYSDFVTGRASLNPQPVSLYSSPAPCGCPATGCGCNG